MAQTWLIVGLGNPGPRYELTRHNVGQLVVDELAGRRGESFKAHKANARIVETWLRPGGPKLILAKPNTFMNVFGFARMSFGPPGRNHVSTMRAFALCALKDSPRRPASSSTTSCPTLCRVSS